MNQFDSGPKYAGAFQAYTLDLPGGWEQHTNFSANDSGGRSNEVKFTKDYYTVVISQYTQEVQSRCYVLNASVKIPSDFPEVSSYIILGEHEVIDVTAFDIKLAWSDSYSDIVSKANPPQIFEPIQDNFIKVCQLKTAEWGEESTSFGEILVGFGPFPRVAEREEEIKNILRSIRPQ